MISLRSEITKKVLNYFFINPDESLYINELSHKLGLDKRNLVKKLKELEAKGILKEKDRGNLKLYSINKDYPLYEEYRKIVMKTTGLEESLRKIMKEVSDIDQAYIYGSYANDKMDAHSDIDLLVVGNHSVRLLQSKLNKFQKEIDREINVINFDPQEFKKRIKNKNAFILGVLKQRHIRIIG